MPLVLLIVPMLAIVQTMLGKNWCKPIGCSANQNIILIDKHGCRQSLSIVDDDERDPISTRITVFIVLEVTLVFVLLDVTNSFGGVLMTPAFLRWSMAGFFVVSVVLFLTAIFIFTAVVISIDMLFSESLGVNHRRRLMWVRMTVAVISAVIAGCVEVYYFVSNCGELFTMDLYGAASLPIPVRS